jgi:hypothetical protein
MIQGYPEQPSVVPGDTLTLHVSTDAPQFRVDFYRQGAMLEFKLSSDWNAGQFADDHDWDQDWDADDVRSDGKAVAGWQGYPFNIPDDWSSGAYIAMFVEGDGNGSPQGQFPDPNTPDARAGKALFVVKSPWPGISTSILYKIPFLTYQAYNKQGGNSLYQAAPVSIHRPGGGTGGTPWDEYNFDPFDKTTNSPRQTFAHWDALCIAWLEENGYRVDYCTDLDVHNDANLDLLSPYALLLSVGHDEYWSDAMRDHVEEFIARGGNVAFFSGNTCWWRAEFDDAIRFRRTANWSDMPVPNRPENSLTGVSYRNAGEKDENRPSVGYRVQHANDWPFENTSLQEGDTFGDGEHDGLVGYECDGANFNRNDPAPVNPTRDDGTPDTFVILGIGDVTVFSERKGNAAATMGMYTNNGTVFTAATTDWARVLSQGEPRVVQITRNVLNRLGGSPKGLAALSNLGDIVACDGFFSPDDNYRHAIVGIGDGNVSEIFFNPQTGQGQTVISNLVGLVDVGAFYSADDNYRHALGATSDGDLWEVFFSPNTGIGRARLGNIPGIVRVAGFFSPDDNYRHAIVATSDGSVYELFYHPQLGQGQALLGNYTGIVDIGAFFSTDDNYRHVIVATEDGCVYELYFNPELGQGQTLLSRLNGVVKVSAFYAADDAFFNRRVIVATSDGRMHEIKFSPQAGIIQSVLSNTSGVIDLGSLFSSDDGFRHVIVATTSGGIQELFYDS